MSDNNRGNTQGHEAEYETWDHTKQANTSHEVVLESFGEGFLALRELLIHEEIESPAEESWEQVSGMEQRETEIGGYPKYLKPQDSEDDKD